ncbi:hypothetical protein [Antribacter gilvus]|uniref:hypothetical protein n=1 Tax=Antribacter gilvus TaxID=2304675 RepID=UPI001F0BDC33|nr:hypothetical protein [Antribacter gilvus]
MTYLAGAIPVEHASGHILVLPVADDGRPASVSDLASAWFSDVAWLREPSRVSGGRPIAGSRFRGIQQADAITPGVLRVGDEHVATGPYELTPAHLQELGLRVAKAEAYSLARSDGLRDLRGPAPSSFDDRDGIARTFPHSLPQGEELRLIQWAVAAARKSGGVVLADGRSLLAPDPGGSVNLGLYSAHALTPGDVLPMLRALIATADVAADQPTADGSPRFTLVGSSSYDGSLVIEVERVDRVPRALGALDWRMYGPFAYRMSWVPAEQYELELEQPSGLHLIARARMRASLARLATSLQSRIAGVIVDEGGFIATPAEVEERNDPSGAGGARVWV